jgi:hypothetical protein
MTLPTFNAEILALRLAKLCAASYQNSRKCGDHIFLQSGHSCCIIVEDEDSIYCAFRGTDEGKDLNTYFDYKKCDSICFLVCKYLETTNKHIYLSGHSIGGLIAQICSTKLCYFNNQGLSCSLVTKIVTFGSPKCKLLVLAPHDKWVNGNDVIADLPFNTINNGQLYFLRRHRWKFWRNSHSIKSYIKNLQENLKWTQSQTFLER